MASSARNQERIEKTQQRIEGLQSEDVKVRKKAARWLGRKGSYDALVYLLAALNDSSWSVRRNAVVALGKIGEIEVVEPLIARLADPTVSVRRAAIQALGNMRDPRATEGMVRLHEHARLGGDALWALLQIGASALLICCDRMEVEGAETPSIYRAAVRRMILQGADRLLIEVLSAEGWSGQQRWVTLEAVRKVQSTLPFFEIWRLTKFGRITEVPSWCERITCDPVQSALHSGSKQVLDFIMLGRASQRDYATEREELLRPGAGTRERDTGETLLRASEEGDTMEALSLLGRLRRWLNQED